MLSSVRRKATCALLLTVIGSMIFGVFHVAYSADAIAALGMNPSVIVDPSLRPGQNFTVGIQISNVSMLFGVEFKVYWNASLMNLWSVTFSFPWNSYFLGQSEANVTLGRYWLSVSGLPPSIPFNGSCLLVSLLYTVKDLGSTNFVLVDTAVGDQNGNAIGHRIVDGFFSNGFHDVEIVRFSVWPTAVEQGDLIFVNVTVGNDGTYREAFGLSVFADRDDGTVHVDIVNQSVVLEVGESRLFEYSWNTTGVPYGSYYVTVNASLVGDFTPADNSAQAFVGGICVRQVPGPSPLIALFLSVVYGAAPVVFLGLFIYGVFVLFSRVRLKRVYFVFPKD